MVTEFGVQEMVSLLKKLVEKRSPEVAAVDRDEVDRLPPARKDLEDQVETIEALAERAGVSLPKAPLKDMRKYLEEAEQLAPLERLLETDIEDLKVDVSNRRELLRRKAFKIFTLNYQAIRAAVEADPSLKTAFAHLEELFALPPRPKKATVTTPIANEDDEKPIDTPKVANG